MQQVKQFCVWEMFQRREEQRTESVCEMEKRCEKGGSMEPMLLS